MERRSDMKRIQNKYIICAGFGFCALNSAVALIPQRSLPREVFGQFVLMAILFAAMAPIAMNDSRPDMQSDSYTWQIISLIPSVSLMIFFVLKVGWWLIALLAVEVGFLSYLMLSRRFRKKRSKKRKRDRR